jgi:hypothetical protein
MANMQQIQNDADFFFFHYKYAGDHEYALWDQTINQYFCFNSIQFHLSCLAELFT